MLSRQAVPGLALLVYDATGLPYVMGLGNGYNRFFGYDAVQRITSFSSNPNQFNADHRVPYNDASTVLYNTAPH